MIDDVDKVAILLCFGWACSALCTLAIVGALALVTPRRPQ